MLQTIIISFLTSICGSGLIYFLIKTWLSEKIKVQFQKELESLKGEIIVNKSILEKSISALENSNQITQQERVLAIKEFWKDFLNIKHIVQDITKFDRVFLEEEFNEMFTPGWNGNQIYPTILEKLKESNIFNEYDEIEKNIERIRPFLSEEIWINFLYLKTFNARIVYVYSIGTADYKTKYWKNDKPLIKLVEDSLSIDEKNTVLNAKIGSVGLYQNIMEQRILMEINKILSGHYTSEESLNRALEINKLLNFNKIR